MPAKWIGREADLATFDRALNAFVGPRGRLELPLDHETGRKLSMLIEGECMGPSRTQAAARFGYTRQRYFQARAALARDGLSGLAGKTHGPRTAYRRTPDVVRRAIQHRFQDPEASSEEIAGALRREGYKIAKRSVDRIFAEWGIRKRPPRGDQEGRL